MAPNNRWPARCGAPFDRWVSTCPDVGQSCTACGFFSDIVHILIDGAIACSTCFNIPGAWGPGFASVRHEITVPINGIHELAIDPDYTNPTTCVWTKRYEDAVAVTGYSQTGCGGTIQYQGTGPLVLTFYNKAFEPTGNESWISFEGGTVFRYVLFSTQTRGYPVCTDEHLNELSTCLSEITNEVYGAFRGTAYVSN